MKHPTNAKELLAILDNYMIELGKLMKQLDDNEAFIASSERKAA